MLAYKFSLYKTTGLIRTSVDVCIPCTVFMVALFPSPPPLLFFLLPSPISAFMSVCMHVCIQSVCMHVCMQLYFTHEKKAVFVFFTSACFVVSCVCLWSPFSCKWHNFILCGWVRPGWAHRSHSPLFHHLLIDRHLGVLCVFTVVNSAAGTWKCRVSLSHTVLESCRYVPRNGISSTTFNFKS